MIRFLIPLILVVLAIILARRYIHAAAVAEQKARKMNVLLIALTIGLLILTLLHRMHWLGALAPILILVLRKCVTSLSGFLNRRKVKAEENNADNATTNNSSQRPSANIDENMDENEALKVLGLQRNYSKDDVVEAHRKLMQKLHPDRGGNDYLAAKINDAKELLLKKL